MLIEVANSNTLHLQLKLLKMKSTKVQNPRRILRTATYLACVVLRQRACAEIGHASRRVVAVARGAVSSRSNTG